MYGGGAGSVLVLFGVVVHSCFPVDVKHLNDRRLFGVRCSGYR